jgi:hypothetical protein
MIINFPPLRGRVQDIATPMDKDVINRNKMIPVEVGVNKE